MVTIIHEICACPREQKDICEHKPWRVCYEEPRGGAARTRGVSFRLRDDAEAFAVRMKHDDLGVHIDPMKGEMSFSQLWEEWVSWGELEPSTVANYWSVYRNHYAHFFGSKSIRSISREDIATWEEAQRGKGYKPYGIQTRRNVLSSVFGHAVTAEYIAKNPCKIANPRKGSRNSSYTPVAEEEIPSLEEVLRIIAEVPKPLRAAFWCMAGSGVRPGEALAISERSLDWPAGTLLVNYQVSAFGLEQIKGTRRGLKRGTKHRSFDESRKAPIPGPVRNALEGHLQTYGSWGEGAWLFESPRKPEHHPSYEWLLRTFKDAARAAGVPEYVPKSFRHFFVSEAIHANIPTWEIAQWVGHRDTRTTEQVYGHLTERSFSRGNSILGAALTQGLADSHALIPPRGLATDYDATV